jgi:endonuclease/exonuclease/phosphatase family metal-dependent hydrolase
VAVVDGITLAGFNDFVRVVTWNMAFWSYRRAHDRAWGWLLDTVKPDVALVQECVVPDWVRSRGLSVHWERAYLEGKQDWGTGIVAQGPLKPARLPALDSWLADLPPSVPGRGGLRGIHRADGWLASASTIVPSLGPTVFHSVHSPSYPIEPKRLDGIDIGGMKLKNNPDLWFTDVLFTFLKKQLDHVLVGGDFNASRLLDRTLGERGNKEFFDRIASEGFVSLHRKFHDMDEQTFFKKGKGRHQLDYLYGDAKVAAQARSCCVVPYEEVREYSDHAPLVVELAD